MVRMEKETDPPELAPGRRRAVENRWCEKYGYLIDVDACRARSVQKRYCGRCLARWLQLPLPFPEPF